MAFCKHAEARPILKVQTVTSVEAAPRLPYDDAMRKLKDEF